MLQYIHKNILALALLDVLLWCSAAQLQKKMSVQSVLIPQQGLDGLFATSFQLLSLYCLSLKPNHILGFVLPQV